MIDEWIIKSVDEIEECVVKVCAAPIGVRSKFIFELKMPNPEASNETDISMISVSVFRPLKRREKPGNRIEEPFFSISKMMDARIQLLDNYTSARLSFLDESIALRYTLITQFIEDEFNTYYSASHYLLK